MHESTVMPNSEMSLPMCTALSLVIRVMYVLGRLALIIADCGGIQPLLKDLISANSSSENTRIFYTWLLSVGPTMKEWHGCSSLHCIPKAKSSSSTHLPLDKYLFSSVFILSKLLSNLILNLPLGIYKESLFKSSVALSQAAVPPSTRFYTKY